MKKRAGIVAWVLLVAGCGTHDQKSALEQQRLLLETIKTQQDTLTTLDKRKQELAELEKAHEKRARELSEKEAALGEQEKGIEADIAELKSDEKKLSEYRSQVQREVRRLEQERALSDRRAEFAKRRYPFLVQLAGKVGQAVASWAPPPPGVAKPPETASREVWRLIHEPEIRQYYSQQFLKDITESGVVGIQDDDEFEDRAIAIAKATIWSYGGSSASIDLLRSTKREPAGTRTRRAK